MGRLHIYALRVTFSIERKRIMDKFKNCGVYEIKNLINGMVAYIKLELIIENNEEVVCWSFHRDIGDNNEM